LDLDSVSIRSQTQIWEKHAVDARACGHVLGFNPLPDANLGETYLI